jgi:hypothetical protein
MIYMKVKKMSLASAYSKKVQEDEKPSKLVPSKPTEETNRNTHSVMLKTGGKGYRSDAKISGKLLEMKRRGTDAQS